jgi:hypothetical protein
MNLHAKRRMVERLEARRNAILSGIFANSNYDPQKEGQTPPRIALIKDVEEEHEMRVREIMEGSRLDRELKELDKAFEHDPFFRPALDSEFALTPEERQEILERGDIPEYRL